MNYLKHLKTIIKHKYWVFYFGRRFGIGWLTFWHDMSKFSPIEFFESVKYYTGTSSPIDACKKDKGYSLAWQHHKGRNPHHYEYWMDNFDNGITAISMPEKYVKEMVCDFLAAGRVYNGKTFTFQNEHDWWIQKKSKPLAMHLNQQNVIDHLMHFLNIDNVKNKHMEDISSFEWKVIRRYLEYLIYTYNNVSE